ncbi:MAG: NAD-dependent epimerase/dehydratase family protein [Candidatus Heimdallarchaeota archaeon]|nr:NAD-dependent epimerase/dehydratase family protein [Candidatus Heimdallarchaeota archaeon]
MSSETSIKGKSVLITGSSGFIGNAYLRKILGMGTSLIQLIDTQPPKPEQIPIIENENVKFIQSDIRDIDSYKTQLEPVDTLIHFAAQPSVPISTALPYYDFSVNVDGSMKLLEFARLTNIEHFVFAASGGTIYGETDKIPTPETERLNPISNYGAAKAAFEMYLRSYASLYDMKTTSLRFGNIFGPGSEHGVMYDFFMKLKTNPAELTILGDGTQTKSYLFIEDCINGFIVASDRASRGFEEFNLSGNKPVDVTKIAELIAKALNIDPEFHYTGGDRGWIGDVRKGGLKTSKIEKLGWKQQTSFEDGVTIYVEWLKENFGWIN